MKMFILMTMLSFAVSAQDKLIDDVFIHKFDRLVEIKKEDPKCFELVYGSNEEIDYLKLKEEGINSLYDLIQKERYYTVLATRYKKNVEIVPGKEKSYNFKRYVIKGSGGGDSFPSTLNISYANVCRELAREEKKLQFFLEHNSGKNELCYKAILLNEDVSRDLANLDLNFSKKGRLELNQEKPSMFSDSEQMTTFKYYDSTGALEKDKNGRLKSFKHTFKKQDKNGKLRSQETLFEFEYKNSQCYPKAISEVVNKTKRPLPSIDDCLEIEKIKNKLSEADTAQDRDRIQELYLEDATRLLEQFFAGGKAYEERFYRYFPSNLEKPPVTFSEGLQFKMDKIDEDFEKRLERLSFDFVKSKEEFKDLTKEKYDEMVKYEKEKHEKYRPLNKLATVYEMFRSLVSETVLLNDSFCKRNYTEKMFKSHSQTIDTKVRKVEHDVILED